MQALRRELGRMLSEFTVTRQATATRDARRSDLLTPRPVQTARGLESRLRLVAAARDELIERNGLLEVNSVADRAGVSVGLIYRHFASRAGLVSAVVDDFYSRYRTEALETNPLPGGPFRDRERKRTEVSVAFHYREPLARVLLSKRHLDDEIAVEEARHTAEMIELAASVMALGQRRGEVPRDRDPYFLGAMVIGGMQQVLAVALGSVPLLPESVTADRLWVLIAAILGVQP
jgi:AcrR family transcriptional regulator